ncbi:unnamed protein product, partial [Allacma fusca]
MQFAVFIVALVFCSSLKLEVMVRETMSQGLFPSKRVYLKILSNGKDCRKPVQKQLANLRIPLVNWKQSKVAVNVFRDYVKNPAVPTTRMFAPSDFVYLNMEKKFGEKTVKDDVLRKLPQNNVFGEMNHDQWIQKFQDAMDAKSIKEVAFPIIFDCNLKDNLSNHDNKAHAALLIATFPTGCNAERFYGYYHDSYMDLTNYWNKRTGLLYCDRSLQLVK